MADVPQRPLDVHAPERFTGAVDSRTLTARQIRLYIETSALSYVVGVSLSILLAGALLWQFAPLQRLNILIWSGTIGATLITRLVAWILFLRARPAGEVVRPWLKWFVFPQMCSVILIGAGPLIFLPDPAGRDLEILFTLTLLVYVATLASTLVLSAYRPMIVIVSVSMVTMYVAGVVPLPGIVPELLVLGSLLAGVWGYRVATRVNLAITRAMELSIRNENLLAVLEARTSALEQQTLVAEGARQAAERAERAKTRFLAAASHDLRQPMHAISLLVGMLSPRAQPAEREVVERLERAVEVMDNLFSTILDLSKLDAGAVKPSFAPVPLREILDSITIHFAPQAASKSLELTVFPSRAIVDTDRAVLERLLRNLVSNAIKYTREGKVLVGCRRRGNRVCIGVWDTGIGIAAEDLDRVFDEYFQANPAPRDRNQGLGLGLAIVRRLSVLLGSEIEVRSAPGRGSRFQLEVPFAGYTGADAAAHMDERAPEGSLAGKFILVVDDEPDVRFGTEAVLHQWGCRSASARSLEAVTAVLERELRFPDAVVTDYRLGSRHAGLDVIAAVHGYTGEATPCVIVTGEDLGEAELETLGRTYPVIKKPLSAEELRKILIMVLRKAAAATHAAEKSLSAAE